MEIENKLQTVIVNAINSLYSSVTSYNQVQLQKTKKDFEGHLTLVVFPFLKLSKKSPEQTAEEIGKWLLENSSSVAKYNVIKGFLNLSVKTELWLDQLNNIQKDNNYGFTEEREDSPLVMVEYSSPNTNKPLHLGHVRNNLLGHSLSEVLKANGYKVIKTNLVNDRGIHICKSMLAWKKWGNGATPESTGKKGDHLVGDFYVLFDKHYKSELNELEAKGLSKQEAEQQSNLMEEAREMLRLWEANDPETVSLWMMMNSWVYAGFDETYKNMGVDFDEGEIYYESNTYLDGKETVMDGLSKGILFQKEDKSIWVDLSGEGLDQKLLLRSDGTSVYMTQDIGTAQARYRKHPHISKMIYVVGNEQNYHFQVLSIVLDKLGFSFGKGLVHFSYGMVELPEGKMKSREGTVVDADDLIDEMVNTARETSKELGKLDNCSDKEADLIAKTIGLGALKYFILKVDPKKNMTFDPKESIDFNGNTGPFIQYTHARIKSVLRKAEEMNIDMPECSDLSLNLSDKEEGLIQLLSEFPKIVKQAGEEYNPALIANYVYELVKEYNQFYHDFSILKEENNKLRDFRLLMSSNIAKTIKQAMSLLGIDVPERM